MHCNICGRDDARVRKVELPVARITHRAHVDCLGHSEYRSLSLQELIEICDDDRERLRLQKLFEFVYGYQENT